MEGVEREDCHIWQFNENEINIISIFVLWDTTNGENVKSFSNI